MADPLDIQPPDSSNESDLNAARSRGERARAILSDPLVEEAFDAIEAEYKAAMANCSLADPDAAGKAMVNVRFMLAALEKFRGHFSQVMNTGKIAKAELAELDRQRTSYKMRAGRAA